MTRIKKKKNVEDKLGLSWLAQKEGKIHLYNGLQRTAKTMSLP